MAEDLKQQILQLKKEKDAVILAHYYQKPEIQEIADVVGDSYFLSKYAQSCPQQVIVFCGVRFMAESAKILSPEKTVLLPVYNAGCPLADMADYDDVKDLIAKHPNAAVVCYINSSSEIKTLCDVVVTSSSAEKILKNIPQKDIIFIPDHNLGSYLAAKLPEKNFILWHGFCITHQKVNPNDILAIKKKIPQALVLTHPECDEKVRAISDYVGSTGGIIDFATKSEGTDFIIATEEGVLYELQKKNPHKHFYVPGKTLTCVNMKKTSLADVYNSLLHMTYEIKLDEETRLKAYRSLDNMHKLSR